MKNIESITLEILNIEKELDLFKIEIGGVKVWQLIRPKIYQIAINLNGSLNNAGKSTTRNLFKKFLYHAQKFIYTLKRFPVLGIPNSDIVIIESSRKIKYKDSFVDPYTFFLKNELIEKGETIISLFNTFSNDQKVPTSQSNSSIELIQILSNLFAKYFFIKISDAERLTLNNITKGLRTKLNIDINILALTRAEIKKFKIEKKIFSFLLRKTSAKKMFIVNYCDKSAYICTARSKGIRVVDVQHGLLSDKDIIYHFPQVQKGVLEYFPDEFYVWSDLWPRICEIPIKIENIKVIGNKYLEANKLEFNRLSKIKNSILVASQDTNTDEVALIFLKNSDFFKDFTVYYKLHPNEYKISDINKNLLLLKGMSNFIFLDKNIDLYHYLSLAEFCFSGYSIVLFEALEFQCRCFVLPVSGSEMMTRFVDEGLFKYLLNPIEDIID